jgi:site-specific recombinase XerD
MKTLELLERKIRAQGKSRETFKTYSKWCKDYFLWLKQENDGAWKHPKDAGKDKVEAWLTHLSNDKRMSANTQNVAMQSVIYLYRHVLGMKIEGLAATRAKRKENVREVLDQSEIQAVINCLDRITKLVVLLVRRLAGLVRISHRSSARDLLSPQFASQFAQRFARLEPSL